jgi:hypothetical protein
MVGLRAASRDSVRAIGKVLALTAEAFPCKVTR